VYRLGLAVTALVGSSSVLSLPLSAQAPQSADLWRLSAASLAGPAALEAGATAAFWNAAAAASDVQLRAGVQLLETPDVLSISGLLGGVSYRVSPTLATQVLVGHMGAADLVRTTTSPASEPGGIPYYEEMLGLGAAVHHGGLSAGALLAGHDARVDADRRAGLTLDAGVRLSLPRLVLAAATHFFPANGTDRRVTDYYAGVEYHLATLRVWGALGRILLRYGLSTGERTGPEHGGGVRLALTDRFSLDANLVREHGYADATWRPTVGVRFRAGRYSIAAARATGLNGIGASYRVGLDVDVTR
jgi:hypothetical protein